ncbi:MAG: hypothetical protein K8J08_15590, partial [Thermoanaerobaculia bacterium]|nr:hypothetical protein [Thermoanaerobaculia bacterium]
MTNPGDPRFGEVVVSPLPKEVVDALRAHPIGAMTWATIVEVRLSSKPGDEELPKLLGRLEVTDNTLRFIPRFPLDPDLPITASFHGPVLAAALASVGSHPTAPLP